MSGPVADPHFSWPVSHAEFDTAIKALWVAVRAQKVTTTKLGAKILSTQADVDALTAALQAEDSELNAAVGGLQTSVTAIQAEIAALKAANPALDLTALTAEVGNSKSQADAVAAAVATVAAIVPPPVV